MKQELPPKKEDIKKLNLDFSLLIPHIIFRILTHPKVFWIILQVLETLSHSPPVLLPLSLTENYLQEVPHPSNNRYITQLFLGQHFRALGKRLKRFRKTALWVNKQSTFESSGTSYLTPSTPNLSQKVQPHMKSISYMWLRTTIAFSFP